MAQVTRGTRTKLAAQLVTGGVASVIFWYDKPTMYYQSIYVLDHGLRLLWFERLDWVVVAIPFLLLGVLNLSLRERALALSMVAVGAGLLYSLGSHLGKDQFEGLSDPGNYVRVVLQTWPEATLAVLVMLILATLLAALVKALVERLRDCISLCTKSG